MALDTWGRMVLDPNFKEDIEATRKRPFRILRIRYLAMVKIYNFFT